MSQCGNQSLFVLNVGGSVVIPKEAQGPPGRQAAFLADSTTWQEKRLAAGNGDTPGKFVCLGNLVVDKCLNHMNRIQALGKEDC